MRPCLKKEKKEKGNQEWVMTIKPKYIQALLTHQRKHRDDPATVRLEWDKLSAEARLP